MSGDLIWGDGKKKKKWEKYILLKRVDFDKYTLSEYITLHLSNTELGLTVWDESQHLRIEIYLPREKREMPGSQVTNLIASFIISVSLHNQYKHTSYYFYSY